MVEFNRIERIFNMSAFFLKGKIEHRKEKRDFFLDGLPGYPNFSPWAILEENKKLSYSSVHFDFLPGLDNLVIFDLILKTMRP